LTGNNELADILKVEKFIRTYFILQLCWLRYCYV